MKAEAMSQAAIQSEYNKEELRALISKICREIARELGLTPTIQEMEGLCASLLKDTLKCQQKWKPGTKSLLLKFADCAVNLARIGLARQYQQVKKRKKKTDAPAALDPTPMAGIQDEPLVRQAPVPKVECEEAPPLPQRLLWNPRALQVLRGGRHGVNRCRIYK